MASSPLFDMDTTSRAADSDERGYATTMHIVTFGAQLMTAGLLHVLVPAVSLFLFQNKSEWLKEHVKEQLNFQITYLIVSGLVAVFTFVTFGLGALVALPVLFIFFAIDIVCSVYAAMAASRGETYRFPFSFRFIR